MAEDLSRLDLFIKVMRMTEGDNDNQSLIAIRKANAMLKAEGWDWDRLLRGKVKVIADPFSSPQKAAPAPEARPAQMSKTAPRPVNPTSPPWQSATAAPDPFAGMGKPKAKPTRPPQQQTAPSGPLHFRRNKAFEWCIASHIRIDSVIGQKVQIEKANGTKCEEIVGPYCEQLLSGHFLYKIGKAGKWKSRFADQSSINDLI